MTLGSEESPSLTGPSKLKQAKTRFPGPDRLLFDGIHSIGRIARLLRVSGLGDSCHCFSLVSKQPGEQHALCQLDEYLDILHLQQGYSIVRFVQSLLFFKKRMSECPDSSQATVSVRYDECFKAKMISGKYQSFITKVLLGL
jgi:hypothetical protein